MNIIEVTLSKNSSKSEPFVFDSIEHILLSYDGDLTSNAVLVVITCQPDPDHKCVTHQYDQETDDDYISGRNGVTGPDYVHW